MCGWFPLSLIWVEDIEVPTGYPDDLPEIWVPALPPLGACIHLDPGGVYVVSTPDIFPDVHPDAELAKKGFLVGSYQVDVSPHPPRSAEGVRGVHRPHIARQRQHP